MCLVILSIEPAQLLGEARQASRHKRPFFRAGTGAGTCAADQAGQGEAKLSGTGQGESSWHRQTKIGERPLLRAERPSHPRSAEVSRGAGCREGDIMPSVHSVSGAWCPVQVFFY